VPDPSTVGTIDLTPHIVGLRERLADANLGGLANAIQAKAYIDGYSARWFIELQAWCARNVNPSATDHVDVPYDWWEHFRERWAPKWWLRRHPVITRRIVIEYYRVCPHADVPWNDPHRKHINWLNVRGMTRDDIQETPKA